MFDQARNSFFRPYVLQRMTNAVANIGDRILQCIYQEWHRKLGFRSDSLARERCPASDPCGLVREQRNQRRYGYCAFSSQEVRASGATTLKMLRGNRRRDIQE